MHVEKYSTSYFENATLVSSIKKNFGAVMCLSDFMTHCGIKRDKSFTSD